MRCGGDTRLGITSCPAMVAVLAPPPAPGLAHCHTNPKITTITYQNLLASKHNMQIFSTMITNVQLIKE